MAPLTKIRVQQSPRSFESCAAGFEEPFLTNQGRGRLRAKRNFVFVSLFEDSLLPFRGGIVFGH